MHAPSLGLELVQLQLLLLHRYLQRPVELLQNTAQAIRRCFCCPAALPRRTGETTLTLSEVMVCSFFFSLASSARVSLIGARLAVDRPNEAEFRIPGAVRGLMDSLLVSGVCEPYRPGGSCIDELNLLSPAGIARPPLLRISVCRVTLRSAPRCSAAGTDLRPVSSAVTLCRVYPFLGCRGCLGQRGGALMRCRSWAPTSLEKELPFIC